MTDRDSMQRVMSTKDTSVSWGSRYDIKKKKCLMLFFLFSLTSKGNKWFGISDNSYDEEIK